jgi:hypothetical protein
MEAIPSTKTNNNLKTLGNALTKDIEDLYDENYEVLIKEMGDYT